MGTNYKIERLYNDLNSKSLELADALDLNNLSSFQKQSRLSELKRIVSEIRALQTLSSYDGTKLLRLPNGTSAPANAAIYGAMMFVQEIEKELSTITKVRSTPKTSTPNLPPHKQVTRSATDELIGIGLGLFAAATFVVAVISFVNGSTGVIDATVGLVLGLILLCLAVSSAFYSYAFFKNN